MRNNEPILLGAGDYLQGPGVLKDLGKIVLNYGTNALILASPTAWEKTKTQIEESLGNVEISFTRFEFQGYCSESTSDIVAENAKKMQADVVVGVGGGKCLDTAKWGSDKAGLRVVTVPTSVATCAAYVSLCVLYDDTGSTIKSVFTKREVGAVVLDTELIATNCPARLFAAGIADALAKEPELYFSIKFSTDWERSVLPDLGHSVAAFNTERYFLSGEKALKDVIAKKVTSELEDVVATNVALTGMVSCLASGGKQLAISHAIYDCICTHFKPQRAKYLHGEIVSLGLSVQMAVNGYEEERIEKLVTFLKALGTPTKFTDIGVDPTPENLKIILEYVYQNLGITDAGLKSMVKEHIGRAC